MLEKIKSYVEPNKKIKTVEIIVLCLLILGSIMSLVTGFSRIHANFGEIEYVNTVEMTRDYEEECDEDSISCEVAYENGDAYLVKIYSYEEYEELDSETITAYEYETEDGTKLYFDHENPSADEVRAKYHEMVANDSMPVFNLGTSLFILALSLGIMLVFSKAFSTYEKCWFMTIMVLATVVAVLFPEESANGVNGIVIMLLYLLDTFLNILCELLISKQSRYNFLVSVLVEITEILVCFVLMYRFATIATTLFFWLPIDILSYINWSKHKDEDSDELFEDSAKYFFEPEEALSLKDGLLKLSDRQRAVLTYRYFYGFTDSEISDLLCISRQAVHQLEMRAIAALKEYYCI